MAAVSYIQWFGIKGMPYGHWHPGQNSQEYFEYSTFLRSFYVDFCCPKYCYPFRSIYDTILTSLRDRLFNLINIMSNPGVQGYETLTR